MIFSATMGKWQLTGRLVWAVAIAEVVWVIALSSGCGSGTVAGDAGQGIAIAQDECLFSGGDNPEKAAHPASMSKGVTGKANIKPDGKWIGDTAAEGSWVRHRINTIRSDVRRCGGLGQQG
ncbi:MAG: hypothetical protein J7M38_04160 [Armatimonadetes bacterium]|nr:hypothetical protein [Armatimonadota bacterium]